MRRHDWFAITGFVVWAGVLTLFSIRFFHFSAPMPGYWTDTQEFARASKIGGTFTPDLYPAILGTGVEWFGRSGIAVAQGFFYLVFMLWTYLIFRLMSLVPSAAAPAAIAIALFPDLVSSIYKVWDLGMTCTAIFGIVACLLLFLRVGTRKWLILLAGICFGFAAALRPNVPSMILPLAFAIWIGCRKDGPRVVESLVCLTAVCAIALVTFYGMDQYAHGGIYLPGNGPYNYFAGANQFTEASLLRWKNAEQSISPALDQDMGAPFAGDTHDPRLAREYSGLATQYVRAHPFRWGIRYSLLKLFTLFRPDTKVHSLWSAVGMTRLVAAMGVLIWICVFGQSVHSRAVSTRDWLIPLVALTYVLPFLVTNSDPRFGFPLIVLLWVHTIALLARKMSWRVKRRTEPQQQATTSLVNAPSMWRFLAGSLLRGSTLLAFARDRAEISRRPAVQQRR